MDSTMERLALYVARRLQRGVFEEYLKAEVEITDEPVGIDRCHLDKRGRRRFEECRAKSLSQNRRQVTNLPYRGRFWDRL